AVSIRALDAYAPAPLKADYTRAIQRGAAWLATAAPATTEDHVFVLLGLNWARHDSPTVRRTAKALIAEQRPDGGWGQLPTLASDAYATGQTLFALTESGVLGPTSSVYRKGVQFLLITKLAEAFLHVPTRTLPVQTYFDSEFPHGTDQFNSTAATNWAVMA